MSRPGAQAPMRPYKGTYTPAYTPAPVHARRMSRSSKGAGFGSKLITLGILAALGWYGYRHFAARTVQLRTEQPIPAAELTPPMPSTFQCDGRKYCSQMTSCTEARLFLKNCPGVQMDGNHDGVPCEQQWCKSPLAKWLRRGHFSTEIGL